MNIIKYHNDINKLKLGSFTESETDIFFSILLKARDNNTDTVVMDFLELKKLSSGDKNNDRFLKNILSLNGKLKALNQTVEVEKGVYLTFGLFGNILADTNKKIIEVPIDKRFKNLICDLIRNFTLFDLRELVNLKGNYAKTLFRLLRQWETTKEYNVKIEDFRQLLGIPEDYRMCNIDQKVLQPIFKQLEPLFKNLKIEKIKRGRSVESLKFTWKAKNKKVKEVPGMKVKKTLGEKDLNKLENEVKTPLDQEKNKLGLKIMNEFKGTIQEKLLIQEQLANIENVKELDNLKNKYGF